MRLSLIAVGRLRKGPEQALVETYLNRITWPVSVHEVVGERASSENERRQRESQRLLDAVPKDAKLIALDQRGKSLTSEIFAERLRQWRDDGVRDIAILIGGAAGFDAGVRRRADLVLSLGRMTWPHLLTRVLLAEQLYRAHSILAGHPYHRGDRT